MNKYIIRNCPAYDCSITEWNCLGSDATECKNGNCILKQIVELCKDKIRIYEYYDKDYALGQVECAKSILQLLDIQEVE